MDEQTVEKTLTPYINAAARHGITAIAGMLAAHGVTVPASETSQITQLVIAAGLWTVGYVWSCLQKKRQSQALTNAINSGGVK